MMNHSDINHINLEGYSLLIAEDDPFSFELMKFLLSDTKANLYYAETGTEAVEIIEKHKIDFVFLDLHLPLMSGYKVLKTIRQHCRKIPVIAQSAFMFQKDKEEVFKAGFTDFVIKPFSKELIVALLKKYLNPVREYEGLVHNYNKSIRYISN